MAEFTKERIIEDLKASTQNASGMFEISEDTICNLMSMLTNAAPQLPQPAVVDENCLLPCPFCGGKPEEDAGGCSEFDGHEHQDYSITCQNCGAEVYCAVGPFKHTDVPCSCHHDIRKVCADKWNRRAAMLQGAEPVQGWIPCSERMPEEVGRYWCYVEEQNSLGKSHYQWNCSWNGELWGGEMMYGRVTHWMPLQEPPKQTSES